MSARNGFLVRTLPIFLSRAPPSIAGGDPAPRASPP
jgi:hypothetical protein